MRIATWLVCPLLASCCLGISASDTGNPAASGGATAGHSTSGGGTGGVGCLTVSPPSLDLGQTLIGESSTATATLANPCAASVTDITASIAGPNALLFSADAPTTLAAGGSAPIHIRYAPIDLGPPSAATVAFSSASGTTATLSVSGMPVGAAVTLAPNPINFGYVTTGETVVACSTLANQTNVSIELASVSFKSSTEDVFGLSALDDASPPEPASIPTTIVPSGSAKVCFSFTPPISEQYQDQAALELTLGDQGAPWTGASPVVQLTGWGGGPQITCTPMRIDFGETLGHSVSSVPVICTNTGSGSPNLTVVVYVLSTSEAVSVQLDQSKDPSPIGGVAPGQSFQIDVNYAPSDGGPEDAIVIVEANVGLKEVDIPISLDMHPVAPCPVVVTPSTLDFGDVSLGETTTPLPLEISNPGPYACVIQGLSHLLNGFQIVATSLNPDSEDRITIPPPDAGVTSSLIAQVQLTCAQEGRVAAHVGKLFSLEGNCE